MSRPPPMSTQAGSPRESTAPEDGVNSDLPSLERISAGLDLLGTHSNQTLQPMAAHIAWKPVGNSWMSLDFDTAFVKAPRTLWLSMKKTTCR